jgi:ribosomal protein L11 methyltransferase
VRPDTLLTIYELRSPDPQGLAFLAGSPEPEELFGPDLAGLHIEEDFAFLFFLNDHDLSPFLVSHPTLELRQIHHLRYDQWQDGANGEPLRVGPLLLLPGAGEVGSELEPGQSSADCPPIYIDPGLAFGFGGHPTTRACLGFLTRLLRPGTLAAPTLATALDLGCGTGVLTLAAARLGVHSVLGVDHSHLAVRCATQNVARNGLQARARIRRGLAQDYAQAPGELVMANLPLFVLKDLLRLRAFENRRYLIYSGLLAEEGEIFQAALVESSKRRFQVLDICRDDRWVSGLLAF